MRAIRFVGGSNTSVTIAHHVTNVIGSEDEVTADLEASITDTQRCIVKTLVAFVNVCNKLLQAMPTQ